MIFDRIKYFPFQLRHGDVDASVCKGPNFYSAPSKSVLFDGSTISVKIPRHRSLVNNQVSDIGSVDGRSLSFRSFMSHNASTKHWIYQPLINRSWSWLKPWFSGSCGDLYILLSAVKREERHTFKNISFFHPNGFELVLSNYLDTLYGHEEKNGHARCAGPLNWQANRNLPIFSATFDISGSRESIHCVFPISNDVFIDLSFSFGTSDTSIVADMKKAARQIVSSLKLNLSNEKQRQYFEVNSNSKDIQLSSNFPPLKWPISKDEVLQREAKLMSL